MAGALPHPADLKVQEARPDRPLIYADMFWPGEKIPRPKRSRRKGARAQTLTGYRLARLAKTIALALASLYISH